MNEDEMSLDEAIEAIELAIAQGDKNAAMLLELVAKVEQETQNDTTESRNERQGDNKSAT